MLVEVLVGRAGAEAGHADEGAVGADDGVPALPDRGLDADLRPARRRSRRGGRRPGPPGTARSTAPRRRGPRRPARRAASAPRPRSRPRSRWRRSRPRALPSRRRDLVGAVRRSGCARRGSRRSCGRFWRVSASTLGVSRRFQRELPALDRLDRVARPEHVEVRDRAQRREMLDRLMRRAVLAEADRVVRHHVDDALAHQRREPDRRPAIVGEHQEGAAVGDDAAVQRHAVHRRGHAVLADAVVDEAAGVVGRRRSPSSPWCGCCWSR